MQSKMNRKGLWLLLTLAVLIVAVSVLVTLAISADGAPANSGEIEDFSYQTVRDAGVLDSDTDLRFLFSIRADKLGDYGAVGFVFSKNNSNPVKESRIVDAVEKRNYFSTDTVYNSVNANGSPIAAPDGRYWVAVSLSDIGHSYFDGALYVRPFVEDTDGTTRYGETKYITVCSALGHTHTVSGSANEGQLFVSGHCDGCNLDDVCEYGITNPEYKRWIGGGTVDTWVESHQIKSFKGDKTFHPTEDNPQGNDLYVEYSVLWNETLLNLSGVDVNESKKSARIETMFATAKDKNTKQRAIAYWSLTDNVADSGAKIAGAFEYPCPQINTSVTGNPYPGMTKGGGSYSDYPNIGGTDEDNPEWGWHRIGIVYHEDVTNLDEVESSGVDAEYKLTVTIYIDGEIVSILSGSSLSNSGNDYKLYTVVKDGGELVYTDINEDLYLQYFAIFSAYAPTVGRDAYFIDGDIFASVGHSFVQNVKRVDNPQPRTETLDNGKSFNAPFYYTPVAAHVHNWGDYETLSEVSLFGNGLMRRYCSVCGANEDAPVTGDFEHSVQKWTSSGSSKIIGKHTVGWFREQNGNKAFYAPGNDLLIEYSVLWNETVLNAETGSSNTYIDTRFVEDSDNSDSKNLIYWSVGADLDKSDCRFAGGFEWGGIKHSAVDNPYPMFTKREYNGGLGIGVAYSDFPNIGGTDQNNPEWGWHRISIRYREEVTNEAALLAYEGNGVAPTATYLLSLWVYVDGQLVIHATEQDLISDSSVDRKLFSAVANGEGGITYTSNDSQALIPIRINNRKAKTDTNVYFEIADLSVTIGNQFVQNVEKVISPTPVDYEIATGVHVNGARYYTIAGSHEHSWGAYQTIHAASLVGGGLERRYCSICGASDDKTTSSTYSHNVQKWSDESNGAYSPNNARLSTIRGSKHFYDEGNDLLVEYSILWNETLTKLDASSKPFMDSRFTTDSAGESGNKNIIYWSLTDGIDGSDCAFAGGFEWGGIDKNKKDNPYPKFTNDPDIGTLQNEFPNIGGANNGDGTTQVNDRYGWHRVSIRYRQEVTNADKIVSESASAKYNYELWVYIDGKLVIHAYSTSHGKPLYTAASNGEGGIAYTENNYYFHGAFLNSKKMSSGQTGYFEIADYSATIGSDFVQKVRPVENPTVTKYTYDGYDLPTTMWYEYAD